MAFAIALFGLARLSEADLDGCRRQALELGDGMYRS
jgi:hypothetical protein